MRIGTGIGGWLDGVGDAAERAEAAGYDYVNCGELAHDSILTMCVAATRTQRLELQTSVTIAFPRAPMVLAMEAWDLQKLSRGRFVLGLGSQVKGHNERRFSVPWSAPAPRMKEYIETIRAIWKSFQEGAPADFTGRHYRYQLMTPNFNPGPIELPRPRIFMAVVGPAMARVAGEVADGVFPVWMSPENSDVIVPHIEKGMAAAEGDKSLADFDIAPFVSCIVGDDLEKCRMPVKGMLSIYIGGMGARGKNFYNDYAKRLGYEEDAAKIQDLFLDGKKAEAMAAVPDELIDEVALVGPRERIAERVDVWKASPVNSMLLGAGQPEALRLLAELVL